MNTITDVIAKLRSEASEKIAEAERLAKLLEVYPDLCRRVGRWEKVAYCSASVNEQVTHFETRYNCGCCADSTLELWPYVNTPYGRVYSDPPKFSIGERDTFTGYAVANVGWKDQLRSAKLPEQLIARVAEYFKNEREQAKALVDSSFEEREEESEPLV